MVYILQAPRRQMGEMTVDHRASPGLTPEQARSAGYDPSLCGEGKLYETHTLTCCECRTVTVMNPDRTRPRETCARHGGHYICDGCKYRQRQNDYRPIFHLG